VAGGVLHLGGKEEEAQAQGYPEKKVARGCVRLRSPWRGSWRRRWPDNGGGTLGQRHGARTVTWSASDTADDKVRTGTHEARTASVARRRLCILAGRNGPVGTAFNQHVHIWTAPPTAANQGTARGDLATDR
jgi:hypothetical protein